MESESILFGIACVLGFGFAAQWFSWKFRIPSILMLLCCGFIAGPVTGLVDPDELLGNLLFPLVSLSVAIILFEGGLSLQMLKRQQERSITFKLITIGLVATWIVAALGAKFLFGLDWRIALLLGAILTVSGPTVVIPLVRHVRPKAPLGELLRWEGILIDPAGALVSVIVFEAIIAGQLSDAPSAIIWGVVQSCLIGGFFGVGAAFLVAFMFKRHLLPEYLENPFALSVVVAIHVFSNHLYPESGLLSVTVMAIVLANIPGVVLQQVLNFKEDLSLVIVSSLFILLAARVSFSSFQNLDFVAGAVFLALLFFLARPLSVFLSTLGSGLSFREKVFLCAVAPRGIVAAAVSSVFAFELSALGYPGAEQLVTITFLVIVGSVVVYGLSASSVAKYLEVAQEKANGVLFVGAHKFARRLAAVLKSNGYPVMLIDTNSFNIRAARRDGLSAHLGSVMADTLLDEVDVSPYGKVLAVTQNDDINSLATLRFRDAFERSDIYQLSQQSNVEGGNGVEHAPHLRGRFLFSSWADFTSLDEELRVGGEVCVFEWQKSDQVIEESKSYLCLFLLRGDRSLLVFGPNSSVKPKEGDKVVVLRRSSSLESEEINGK